MGSQPSDKDVGTTGAQRVFMKKTNEKKLKISRDTIRVLQARQLQTVVGGNSGICTYKTGTECPTTNTYLHG
jgi:hypothetical protein